MIELQKHVDQTTKHHKYDKTLFWSMPRESLNWKGAGIAHTCLPTAFIWPMQISVQSSQCSPLLSDPFPQPPNGFPDTPKQETRY